MKIKIEKDIRKEWQIPWRKNVSEILSDISGL